MKLCSLIGAKIQFAFATLAICTSALAHAQTPVAHWTFDEGLNDYALDAIDSINGNNGVWQAATRNGLGYTAGMLGGAARLRGNVSEYFLVPSIPQLDGIQAVPPFPTEPQVGVGATWMAWIKVDANEGPGYNGIIMSRTVEEDRDGGPVSDRNWGLAWEHDYNSTPLSHIDGRVGNTGFDSAANSIVLGQWHHVALVWGNADPSASPPQALNRLYVDGTQVFSANSQVYELISSGSWAIGSDPAPLFNNRTFGGLLDDIAVFNSALTPAQVLQKYNDGLSGINAAGAATTQLAIADVDGMGGVNINDFHIIRDNLGKNVNARNLGDINGDRKVNLNDFQLWLHSAPAEVVALAMAVPEPSSMALIGIGLVAAGLGRRRLRGNLLVVPLVTMLALCIEMTASAQNLVLEVDRVTGQMSLTGANEAVVSLAAYRISSQHETLIPGNFNGLRDTEADWVLAGPALPSGVQELNANGNPLAATFINSTVSFGLGNMYNPTQAVLDAGFGVDVEANDLGISFYDTVLNQTLIGTVRYVGEKIHNNIGVTVNLIDGTAILENESPFNQVITGYLIEAGPGGGLNTDAGTFNGVGGSFQSPAILDGENLGQLDPTGVGIALNAGQSINLGQVGFVNGLSFSFLLAGASETSRVGFVKYISPEGDFDADGDVDGRDFLIWQRGGSPNPLSSPDLTAWQANYGPLGGSQSAAVSVVPEPSVLVLASVMLVVSLGCRRDLM